MGHLTTPLLKALFTLVKSSICRSGIVLFSTAMFLGCSSDEKSFAGDVSGIWEVTMVENGDCSGVHYPKTKEDIVQIVQNGSDILVIFESDGEQISGKIDGHNVTWQSNQSSGSGTIELAFSGEVSNDGNEFIGSANWTYQSSSSSCSGTTAITAHHLAAPAYDLTGALIGTITSDVTLETGTFRLDIVQSATGALKAGLSMSFASSYSSCFPVEGRASGEGLTFEEEMGMNLIGQTTDGKNFSGTYSQGSDTGKWQAYLATKKKFSVAERITPTDGEPAGLAWDGNTFYFTELFETKIFSMDKTGQTQLVYDGDWTYFFGDITYDGTSLWIVDRNFGKIVNISKDGNLIDTIQIFPAENHMQEITGIAADGQNLWIIEDDYTKEQASAHKINSSGDILSSFNLYSSSPRGMAFYNDHLWIIHSTSYWSCNDTMESLIAIYEIDAVGNVVSVYEGLDIYLRSLVFVDNELWAIADDDLVRLNLQ
ncbi:MAG: hypothetical protein JW841_12995 [Deltaproteobacteria bacterium]|nr:hypothetical protein [Deltaproteobacteria bacterium]